MKHKAICLRSLQGWAGDARLYRLTVPIKNYEEREFDHVIVSAVNRLIGSYHAHETYIFPAKADGTTDGMLELPGSYRGGTDHAEALRGAGYYIE